MNEGKGNNIGNITVSSGSAYIKPVGADWNNITFGWVNEQTLDKLRLAQDFLTPKKVIYNDRTTIVIWSDDTKTISTCSDGETFDEEVGFAMCLLKKVFNKKVYGKKLYKRIISKAEHQTSNKNVVLEPATLETISNNLKKLSDYLSSDE